jgi:hypothetical protein
MSPGERVRIVGVPGFDGKAASVVQNQDGPGSFDRQQPPRGRVYVLIEGTDNPVPFRAEQLRRAR